MDGFTYHDIFETKGIEYLVIIGFLILLVPFWVIINKRSTVAQDIRSAIDVLTASLIRIPQGLFYSKNHTWAHLQKSGTAKVGLDDFLMQVVGNVQVNPLKAPGEQVKKGEKVAEIMQNGKRLQVVSPISGEISQTNETVIEMPEIVNRNPYYKGWIYDIKPSNWKAETNSYFLAKEASAWIKQEIDRFKDFLAVSSSRHSGELSLIALQEGGEIRKNVLAELDEKIWKDFEDSFLS